MSYDKSVADHYLHGNLLDAIKIALLVMGKTIETATIEDLAAVDEFHVGMNIDDKVSLFTEIFRVGIYDIMRQQDGELTYPVPWATDSSTSKLSTLLDYIQALQQASFDITQENNRRDFSLGFFNKLRVKQRLKEVWHP
jgi:hypothetical protein